MKTFRGYHFDERTIQMIKYVEKELGKKLTVTQGSYSKGTVAASAGTHDGGGAVDFSAKGYTEQEIKVIVRALRDAGFAAWHRLDTPNVWPEHIHAIAIACPDLAQSAKNQVKAFDKHKDGLKTNKPDYSYHPKPKVKFDAKLNKPVKRGIFNRIK